MLIASKFFKERKKQTKLLTEIISKKLIFSVYYKFLVYLDFDEDLKQRIFFSSFYMNRFSKVSLFYRRIFNGSISVVDRESIAFLRELMVSGIGKARAIFQCFM